MTSTLPSQVFIVRDDLHGDGLNLGGGTWDSEEGDNYFNNFVECPEFSKNIASPRGSFSYTFDGTSIRLVGLTVPAGNDDVFQVTIDNNAPYNTSTDSYKGPINYRQWYQSPLLSEGQHTIKVERMNGQALDYMIITPSADTPLAGHTLMVDDSYSGIQYSKGWEAVSSSTFVDSSIWGGSNFMNTTHTTRTAGETMKFSYAGTNASVFGVFLREQVGSLSFTYSIDGGANFATSLTSSGADPNATNFVKEQPNYKLFETGPLTSGNHTLTLTLTGCVSQTLVVDYILYSPSFTNLASMPNLTISSPSPTPTVSQNGLASSSSNDKPNVGIIAGDVVGGVALLVVLLFLLWWLKRRRSRRVSGNREIQGPEHIVEAFPVASTGSPLPLMPIIPMSSKSDTYNSPTISTHPYAFSLSSGDSAKTVGPTSPVQGSGEPSSPAEWEYEQLRRRVEHLTAENVRLTMQTAPPPAYD